MTQNIKQSEDEEAPPINMERAETPPPFQADEAVVQVAAIMNTPPRNQQAPNNYVYQTPTDQRIQSLTSPPLLERRRLQYEREEMILVPAYMFQQQRRTGLRINDMFPPEQRHGGEEARILARRALLPSCGSSKLDIFRFDEDYDENNNSGNGSHKPPRLR